MRLGVFCDGFSSTGEMRELAVAAEEAGAHSLWFAPSVNHCDPFVALTAAAGETRRIILVPTAIAPSVWPPFLAARAMAALAEASNGRTAIAVSVSGDLNLGEAEPPPMRAMRAYVQALRESFRGEAAPEDAPTQERHGVGAGSRPGSSYPIYVATAGPLTLKLAAKTGDGVLLPPGLALDFCHRCLEEAEAGLSRQERDPASLRKAAFVLMNVSADAPAARRAMLRKLALLFRNASHADNIASSGLDIDHARIIDHLAQDDLDAATRCLPEKAARTFAVAGTPTECRDRLQEYLAIGLDEPVVEISGTPDDRRLALAVVRDVVRDVAKSRL